MRRGWAEVCDGTLWRCPPPPSSPSSAVEAPQGADARLHGTGVGGSGADDGGRLLRGPRRPGWHHRLGRPAPRRPAIQRQQHEHPADRAGLAQRPGRQRPALVDPQAPARGRLRRRRLQHQHADPRARRSRRQSGGVLDSTGRLGALQRRPGIQPHQDQGGLRPHQAVRRPKTAQPGRERPERTGDEGPRSRAGGDPARGPQPDRRPDRLLRRGQPGRLLRLGADPGRGRGVPEPSCVRLLLRRRLPGRAPAAGRGTGAGLRPAAARPGERGPRPHPPAAGIPLLCHAGAAGIRHLHQPGQAQEPDGGGPQRRGAVGGLGRRPHPAAGGADRR